MVEDDQMKENGKKKEGMPKDNKTCPLTLNHWL